MSEYLYRVSINGGKYINLPAEPSVYNLTLGDKKYKGFSSIEKDTVQQYLSNWDKFQLADDFKKIETLSKAMLDFISDVMTDRGKGEKLSTHARDFGIYQEIMPLLTNGTKLTSGREDGAATKVAALYGIEEDAAIKAFYRIDKEDKKTAKAINELAVNLADPHYHAAQFNKRCAEDPQYLEAHMSFVESINKSIQAQNYGK